MDTLHSWIDNHLSTNLAYRNNIFTFCPLTMLFDMILCPDSPFVDRLCEGSLRFMGIGFSPMFVLQKLTSSILFRPLLLTQKLLLKAELSHTNVYLHPTTSVRCFNAIDIIKSFVFDAGIQSQNVVQYYIA